MSLKSSSPIKNTIKIARKEFAKTPKYKKRRKSSIPLQLVEFIKNNELNQNKNESTKNSYRIDFSGKKNYLRDIINSSIPEESENSSNINNKDDKNKKDKKENKQTKNGIENNNYYIHYIKNVYENEPHFKKNRILKSEKKLNNEDFKKFEENNENMRLSYKRRHSCFNKNVLKSNTNNLNMILEKENLNSKLNNSIINKKKVVKLSSLIHKKKNLEEREKDHIKVYNNSHGKNNKISNKDKKKTKKKEKDKDKEKEDGKENNKEKDKFMDEENNIILESTKKDENINKKKKVKQKTSIESDKKEEIENNTSNKTNIKSKFKKFLCCFINNEDSSFDNK